MVEIVLIVTLYGQLGQTPQTEPPPKIAKLLELCERSRRGAILQLEHKLRGLRQQSNARATAKNPLAEDSDPQIAKLKRQLEFLQTTPLPVIPTISFPPQVGAIGRLPGESCHVDQIVSAKEMVVRCFFQVPVVTVRNFKGQREIVEESVPCVIRGLHTSKFREGTDFETDSLYEVVGTETYQTAGGKSRQLVVLRPFDRKTLEKYLPTSKPQ
jgi:hypothetical protein